MSITLSTPLQSSVSQPTTQGPGLAIYQNSAPNVLWTIVDANGNPVVLTGKNVRFVACDAISGTEYFEMDSLSVSGASNNIVTAPFAAGHTAVSIVGARYDLWDITDNLVLASGVFEIKPSAYGSGS